MCITGQQVTKAAQHRAERRVMRYVASHMGNMMRITEGQLRRIIREELNESMKGDVKGATLSRNPVTGKWEVTGMSDIEGRGARAAMKLREPEILSVGDPEYLRRKLAAGELEGYYEDEPGVKATEQDPEDPYGEMPKGSRIPGGTVHTAGFKPGDPRVGGNENLKQDIFDKLKGAARRPGTGGLTERGIVMSLPPRYKPAQIEAALRELTADEHILQDENGLYRIPSPK